LRWSRLLAHFTAWCSPWSLGSGVKDFARQPFVVSFSAGDNTPTVRFAISETYSELN
jgi:hypothetical protein